MNRPAQIQDTAPQDSDYAAKSKDTQDDRTAQDTAPSQARWSEGTFGSNIVSQRSSTYSGLSAEASIACVANPTLVDTQSPDKENTFEQYAAQFSGMNSSTLDIVISSGHAAKQQREDRTHKSRDEEEKTV